MFKIGSKFRLATPAIMLAALLVSGCSSMVMRPVAEQNKDVSGSYDGSWAMMVKKASGTQHGPGNWVFTCRGKAGRLGVLSVTDGVATLSYEGQPHTAYIGQSGKFRFEVPLSVKAKAGGMSDSSVDRNEMTMIVGGSLRDQGGFLTWGIAEFANNGCTSKVSYARV